MLIYLCLSSHGFGHVARQAAVLSELIDINPNYRFVISSNVRKEFLKLFFKDITNIEFRIFKWDVGTIQNNAFDVDKEKTLSELDELENNLPYQITVEAEWIKSQKLETLIIADIPPGASLLAKELNCRLIWFGNFGWDDIYRPFGSAFEKFTSLYNQQYSSGDLLIRCPFSLGMNWGLPEKEIGITCSKTRELPYHFLESLKLSKRPIVMIAFGGFGYRLDINAFSRWSDYLFVVPKSLLIDSSEKLDTLKEKDNILLLPDNVRMLDALVHCSRIITKPGYSTFCESIGHSLGVHAVRRHDFIESEILIDGLKKYTKYRILDKNDLIENNWQLDKELFPNQVSESKMKFDGAFNAASIINKFTL